MFKLVFEILQLCENNWHLTDYFLVIFSQIKKPVFNIFIFTEYRHLGFHFFFQTFHFYSVNTSYPMDNSLSGRHRPARQTSEKDVLCLHRQVGP